LRRISLDDYQDEEWECGHLVIRKLFLIFIMMVSQISINTPTFAFEPMWFENVVIPLLEKDPFTKESEKSLKDKLITFTENLKAVFTFFFFF